MGKVKSSGGSQKNLKKSLLCPKTSQKVTFMSGGTCLQYICTRNPKVKNLKKSLFCPKKSQKATWEPDAVRLQHKIEHVSQVEAAGWDPDAAHG